MKSRRFWPMWNPESSLGTLRVLQILPAISPARSMVLGNKRKLVKLLKTAI
ncbi:hypothetical protein predicted by Glimmer [Corynebacterium glutamicum ATCC 13032]|nr:hypothetical protein predicted by Glimmer [Corynebacterium glutamicum ATCC 13032]